MLPIHELRRNDNFLGILTDKYRLGLNPDKLGNLKSYMHFRKVQNSDKKDLIDRDEALTSFNFLDEISNDPIKNSWSIHLDNTKTLVS